MPWAGAYNSLSAITVKIASNDHDYFIWSGKNIFMMFKFSKSMKLVLFLLFKKWLLITVNSFEIQRLNSWSQRNVNPNREELKF